MTCLEHYFENLLFRGCDIKGEPNKKALSKIEQEAVEQCAIYVIYSLFGNRELFLEWHEKEMEEFLCGYGTKI